MSIPPRHGGWYPQHWIGLPAVSGVNCRSQAVTTQATATAISPGDLVEWRKGRGWTTLGLVSSCEDNKKHIWVLDAEVCGRVMRTLCCHAHARTRTLDALGMQACELALSTDSCDGCRVALDAARR